LPGIGQGTISGSDDRLLQLGLYDGIPQNREAADAHCGERRITGKASGKFGGQFACRDAARGEGIIARDGAVGRDREETIRHAPADILGDLFVKISKFIRSGIRKYERAFKLYLLAWIDFDLIKASELVALTTLELALTDRYGESKNKQVRDRLGNISFPLLLRYMVEGDKRIDELLPVNRRCGLGSVVRLLTGEIRPTLAEIRNELAHGYLFDGLPRAGLLEVIRDLIEYAYRGMIAEVPGTTRYRLI
jgi:hypothetical protein